MNFLKDLARWTVGWAATPFAGSALFGIAFAESSFFPIPPDLLLIPLCLANPKMALGYAAVCTAGSVLGGMFGFLIGLKGGRPLLLKVFSNRKVALVEAYFRKYDVWAVGIAAFTPIPYKVFTIAAGVFDLDFKRFVLTSVVGRGWRFFLVAGLIMIFGETIRYFLSKYFELAVTLIAIALVGGFYLIHHLARRQLKAGQN